MGEGGRERWGKVGGRGGGRWEGEVGEGGGRRGRKGRGGQEGGQEEAAEREWGGDRREGEEDKMGVKLRDRWGIQMGYLTVSGGQLITRPSYLTESVGGQLITRPTSQRVSVVS